jgi:hypothetical protein
MTFTVQGWENGSWALVITDNDGDPSIPTGTLGSGTYKKTTTTNGEKFLSMKNLNLKRGTYLAKYYWDAKGGISWTLDITDDATETISNGEDSVFKPTWDTQPLKVSDTWQQTNHYNLYIKEKFVGGGQLAGSGSLNTNLDIDYKYTYTIANKASKTIPNTRMGATNFANGYQVARTGSYDYTFTDGTNTDSGTITSGPYEYWYGGDGDNFDASWAIDYNASTRLIWSTHSTFINTKPTFTTAPKDTNIKEDEVWNFKNGVDYAVGDPDPGTAGQLGYTIKKALGTNTNVLKNLTIDPNTGEITFTPNQKDVADGYKITINATDKYSKGPLGDERSFILNIKNKNDPPTANSAIMIDFNLTEGQNVTPTWKLSDVFKDPDMAPNPLMKNAPYDPNERLNYSVINNGSIEILCPNNKDLGPANQCDVITFQAIDGKFPNPTTQVTMTITATDTGTPPLKASDLLSVTVKHVNHKPIPVEAKQAFTMKEGDTQTIELKTWFKDQDVNSGNLSYQTGDTLSFDHVGEKHISVQITGTKAKLWFDTQTDKLAAHWNGQEEITLTATDKAGAKSDPVTATIIVTPVNDAPYVVSVAPTAEPTIYETNDATAAGQPGTQKLTVTASDYDNTVGVNQNQVLTYNWTVENDAQDKYTVSTHDSQYIFTAAFDCDFEKGKFCGETKYGDTSRTYSVTAYVSDGVVAAKAHKWFVTVKDVPRRPVISGIDVFTVSGANRVPLTASSPGNYTISYGKVLEFDVTNQITAPDLGIEKGQGIANIDKLTFEWSSTFAGSLGQTAKIDVGAGTKSGTATVALSAGKTQIITVRVGQGSLSTTYAIMVKVGKKPTTGIPGFESVVFVVSVGVAVALVAYRRRK